MSWFIIQGIVLLFLSLSHQTDQLLETIKSNTGFQIVYVIFAVLLIILDVGLLLCVFSSEKPVFSLILIIMVAGCPSCFVSLYFAPVFSWINDIKCEYDICFCIESFFALCVFPVLWIYNIIKLFTLKSKLPEYKQKEEELRDQIETTKQAHENFKTSLINVVQNITFY